MLKYKGTRFLCVFRMVLDNTFVLFDSQVKKQLQVSAKELIDKQVKVIINTIEVLHFLKKKIPFVPIISFYFYKIEILKGFHRNWNKPSIKNYLCLKLANALNRKEKQVIFSE